jgi:hypothetical protein
MTEPQRTCPRCGNEFAGTMEFCPVCMLHKALADGVESGESSASEEGVKPTPEQATQRFEHYELVTGEDGKHVELGRGAMGVTYKAFDVDLHCPVTLKVISEKYLGDESARLLHLGTKCPHWCLVCRKTNQKRVPHSTLVNHWLKGHEAELRSASDEFGGHSFAVTLLGWTSGQICTRLA